MKTVWTKNLKTKEQKEHFEGLWIGSAQLRERLEEILDDMYRAEMEAAFSESSFDDPNWSSKQAYVNGKLSAYKKVLDIMK